MKICKINTETIVKHKTYIALGNFDGIHKGHMSLLNGVIQMAKRANSESSVLIFEEHTKNKINGKKQVLLTSKTQKYKILAELGIDIIYEMEFTESVMKMSPEDFISKFLKKHLQVQGIVVGFDYRFGYKASGDVELLRNMSVEQSYFLKVISPIYDSQEIVSSTLIRKYIQCGNIKRANELLNRPFSMEGVVVHGKKLGTRMGYPTANISITDDYVIPKFAVYNTRIIIKGKKFKAATSVGTNPTLNEVGLKIEAHILDFNEIIYGEKVQLQFLDYIREELIFSNLEDLFLQIEKDRSIVENTKF